MPPKHIDEDTAKAFAAGFNGETGAPGASSALGRLRALLGGQAETPTPQGQALQQMPESLSLEQQAKLKALQGLGGQ